MALVLLYSLSAPGQTPSGYVALTFDDGPVYRTSLLLTNLKNKGVRATFFIKGDQISKWPLRMQRILNEGHAAENHSFTHPHLAGTPQAQYQDVLTKEQIRKEILDTNDAIVNAGGPRPTFFRPPFGEFNADVVAVQDEEGMIQVLWNVDSGDSAPTSPTQQQICDNVVNGSQANSVVLMHDWNINTINALPCIINGLRAKGLELGRLAVGPPPLPNVGYVRVVPWE
jgi:peptidoglycan/xylan/chitin deacetylase (PgdA/CDA1 family)